MEVLGSLGVTGPHWGSLGAARGVLGRPHGHLGESPGGTENTEGYGRCQCCPFVVADWPNNNAVLFLVILRRDTMQLMGALIGDAARDRRIKGS